MTNGLNGTQVKILTWLVYAMMCLLTSIVGWQQIKITGLSNEYVRLERYQADSLRADNTLCRIENKLDQLIIAEKK